MSLLARVYFSQASVVYFCRGFSCCPYNQDVRYNGVSARRELTVLTKDKIESGITLGHVLINVVDVRKTSVNTVARSTLFQTKYL